VYVTITRRRRRRSREKKDEHQPKLPIDGKIETKSQKGISYVNYGHS
jgi:hypothetical protein